MTLIFQRDGAAGTGFGTHALVLGVGAYPFAKPGQGKNDKLRQVPDLASAADSAKRTCDWLIENKDRLSPPLGSIEVLISDVAGGALPRYATQAAELAVAIDPVNRQTIPAAQQAWLNRLSAQPGGNAFFYGCGHGASYGTRPVLFHSDLNERDQGAAYAHLNVGLMAQAFRQRPEIAAGFFFLDACGEFVTDFPPEVPTDGFITPSLPNPATDRDKVWLLVAASAALLAYPGVAIAYEAEIAGTRADTDPNARVKLGRFTQTLLKGLDGASCRWNVDSWSVDNMGLWSDLRFLHRAYFPAWADRIFEPSQYLTPNNRFSIVRHEQPLFPVLVSTDPMQRNGDFDLSISMASDGTGAVIDSRPTRCGDPWLAHVKGDRSRPYYALAQNRPDPCCFSFFKAEQPQYDQRVPLL